MANLNVKPRFTSTCQPIANGRKKGTVLLTPILTKLLNKEINVPDPLVEGQMARMPVAKALVWKLLLEAAQGDMKALEMIFERVDGKVVQQVIADINYNKMETIVLKSETVEKPLELEIG